MHEELIREISYELYKQHWIDTHTTEEQRLDDIRSWGESELSCSSYILYERHSYAECLAECGLMYTGALYVCFEEFLGCEYMDEVFMRGILKSELLIKEYLKDKECLSGEENING